MDVPFYPPLARAANVQGVVRLRVETNGQQVKDVSVVEGTRLLADVAEQNVRSWQFFPAEPTTFIVTFSFKFAKPNAKNFERLVRLLPDAEIRTELPLFVEMTVAPRPNQGDYSPDRK